MSTAEAASIVTRPAQTAVIYLRVSSVGQLTGHQRDGYSIDAQREICTRHAERLGATVAREYVEPGKSATTRNRPRLQALLADLPELRPDYVIFYDLSRSARDEFDAFWLLREISAHGAKLESTQERVDDSAEGMLQFAIMSSVNAFRSRNDGKKVKLGLDRKHQDGGTVGPARLGYLNVREEVNGRQVASVALDPVRAPLVKLAFDLAATGQHTISEITDILEFSGLTTRATPSRPERPLGRSSVHRLLTSDYYTGVVTRNGVTTLGRHTRLIATAVFERVQANLAAQRASGSRGRKHHHYLSGQLTCGRCGKHHGYGRHRNRHGNIYEYYSCLSRVTPSGPCGARYVQLGWIETELTRIHARPWLTAHEIPRVRAAVRAAIEQKSVVARTEADRHTRRLEDLERQHHKLLQLYYRDGVSLELMQQEQARIARERVDVERWQQTAQIQVDELMQALDEALALVDGRLVYDELPAHERRLLNLALFDDFVIEEQDGGLQIEPEREQTYVVLRQFADLVMADGKPTSRPTNAPMAAGRGPDANAGPVFLGQGSHKDKLAERAGFEPAMEFNPHTRLAGECLQPLGHLSWRGRPSSLKGACRVCASVAARCSRDPAIGRYGLSFGGVAERLNALVLKTRVRESGSRVRIPPPPSAPISTIASSAPRRPCRQELIRDIEPNLRIRVHPLSGSERRR
jgi:site-specific DNA recombinase